MTENEKKERTFAEFRIIFPKAPEKAKDKEVLFNKILSLIEESKESLPVKVKSNKRRKQIILDSDEFMFIMSFKTPLSTRILVNEPEKNIDTVNDVGNKVINYMNTILGEGATSSSVSSFKRMFYPRKTNLSKKLIGDTRLAKINEKAEQALNPVAILLEYELKEKVFALSTFSGKEENMDALLSMTAYKDKMPFNLLRKEYDELAKPEEIIKKLTEMEL